MYHCLIPAVLTTLFMQAWAYSTGANSNFTNPLDALKSHCSSGNYRPNHGDNLPQPSPPPYTITLNSPAGNIYRPGQPVTITIEGNKSPATQTFKGFFVQGDATEASFAGNITCGNMGKKVNFCAKPGATHVDAEPKEKVVCQWIPPDFQIGRVQFVATIVHNFKTFWTGVKSTTTLLADPSTLSYAEKSRQLHDQLLRHFQQRVPVTIESNKSPATQTFKGFFVQGDATEASFAGNITCGNLGKKVNFCAKTGPTHLDAEPKVCQWIPPDVQNGRVQFLATIVHNFKTFWTGVKSTTTLLADPSTLSYVRHLAKFVIICCLSSNKEFKVHMPSYNSLLGNRASMFKSINCILNAYVCVQFNKYMATHITT